MPDLRGAAMNRHPWICPRILGDDSANAGTGGPPPTRTTEAVTELRTVTSVAARPPPAPCSTPTGTSSAPRPGRWRRYGTWTSSPTSWPARTGRVRWLRSRPQHTPRAPRRGFWKT